MAKYIALIDFTEKGLREIKDTTKRAKEFQKNATRLGVRVQEILWTVGPHDGVLIYEAPDDETSCAALLSLGSLGFVRTKTLKAYGPEGIGPILARV